MKSLTEQYKYVRLFPLFAYLFPAATIFEVCDKFENVRSHNDLFFVKSNFIYDVIVKNVSIRLIYGHTLDAEFYGEQDGTVCTADSLYAIQSRKMKRSPIIWTGNRLEHVDGDHKSLWQISFLLGRKPRKADMTSELPEADSDHNQNLMDWFLNSTNQFTQFHCNEFITFSVILRTG